MVLLAWLWLMGCDQRLDEVPSELCNDLDDDGDGRIDEDPVDESTFFLDVDGDGYGDSDQTLTGCDAPDDFVSRDGDCDDAEVTISPGAAESCDDVDEDCDGVVDEDPTDGRTGYADGDGDGWGAGEPVFACTLPTRHVTRDGDCDDEDVDIHPEATEWCDEVDEDCDGTVDEDAADALEGHLDADRDGYGRDTGISWSCTLPDGYLEVGGDCDDEDTGVSPDAVEVCSDGVDNDCDGTPAGCALWGGMSLVGADRRYYGADAGEGAGSSLSGVGDFDGDGVLDWVVGAPEDDDVVNAGGAVYLVLGPSSGGPRLSDQALVLQGLESYGRFGASVAGGGDVDGDGFGELIVGAPYDDSAANQGGAVYLFEGPLTGVLDTEAATAVVLPEDAGTQLGFSVAGGEDLDGDGLPEWVGGARWLHGDGTERGGVVVVSGVPTGTLELDDTVVVSGDADGDGFGETVALAPDLDGDGYAELLVGAPYVDVGVEQAGAAYRYGGGVGDPERLATLQGSDVNEYLGSGVAGGDGWFAVVAPGQEASDGAVIGAAYWVAGTVTGVMETSDVAVRRSGQADTEAATAVAFAGDVDGDGHGDWLVTAPGEATGGPGAGAVWLFYGPMSGASRLAESDALLAGVDDWDRAGSAAAGAGDLDGDGYDDVLVGASAAGPLEVGAAYLLHGGGY